MLALLFFLPESEFLFGFHSHIEKEDSRQRQQDEAGE
jgi:hypothetical protein